MQMNEHKQSSQRLSKEMWIILILFAGFILSNSLMVLALIFLGPAFILPIIIGYALAHLAFFLSILIFGIYYIRRRE